MLGIMPQERAEYKPSPPHFYSGPPLTPETPRQPSPAPSGQNTITANSLEMKGLVLAGGRGTRLHPLTAETSKQLLPVGDKPLVLHVIDQLLQADVKDILLLIDDRHASQFMQVLQDGSHLGIRS